MEHPSGDLKLLCVPHSSDHRTYLEHRLGYFRNHLSPYDTDLIARLVLALCHPQEVPILAFYPIDELEWKRISESDWMTVLEKVFIRKGLLRNQKQVLWTVGYANTATQLARVIAFAWNIAADQEVLIIPSIPDCGDLIGKRFNDDMGGNPTNATTLLKEFPIVCHRGYDGTWLSIYATHLTSESVLATLNEITHGKIVKVE